MKLLSYLQTFHGFARRKAVQAIKDSQIVVNDKKVESYQMELKKGDRLSIKVPGLKPVTKIIEEFVTGPSKIVLFHKPIGYVVSKADPHNQTIYFLLPESLKSYDYIGRLDKDSSGLLLLTNDKKKVNELGHPSSGLLKTYVVRVDVALSPEEIERTKKGIKVTEDGELAEARPVISEFKPIAPHGKGKAIKQEIESAAKQVQTEEPKLKLEGDILKFVSIRQEQMKGYVELTIKLAEGHKRHIRRVIRALGKKVFELHRISFGDYSLGRIKPGEREYAREAVKRDEAPKKPLKYKKIKK